MRKISLVFFKSYFFKTKSYTLAVVNQNITMCLQNDTNFPVCFLSNFFIAAKTYYKREISSNIQHGNIKP